MKQIIPLVAVVMSLSAVAGNEANPDAVELAPIPVPVEFTSNMDAPVAFDAPDRLEHQRPAGKKFAERTDCEIKRGGRLFLQKRLIPF